MKKNEALRGRYEKIAHRWNCAEYDGLRRDDLIPTILDYSDLTFLPQSATILEAMCGTGNIGKAAKEFLEKQGKNPGLYFLDFSQAMLDKITIQAEKISCDVRKTPFLENFFDRIFLRGGLHDLPKEFQLDAIKEIYRILKPGGMFTLIVSYAQEEAQKYLNEVVRLRDTLAGNAGEMERYFATKKEYCDLLLEASFKNLRNPLDYMGKISYSATIELDAEGGKKIDVFFENLPEKIKGLWYVRRSGNGFMFNFPYAILTVRK